MSTYNIMAIVINRRSKNAVEVQNLLTKYGCIIKMRLGLHEAGNVCSEEGLVLLQLAGDSEDIENFEKELNNMDGVRTKLMEI
jgi:metal-responsive CopG/Arc/MetJ family transcriptional regulator